MTPFGSITFFLLLLGLALPAIALGLSGRRIGWWGLVASVVVDAVVLFPTPGQALLLLLFLLWQLALVDQHLAFLRSHGRTVVWERRLVVALSLLPLVLEKVTGAFGLQTFGFIGISYLTFKALQLVLEASDGLITEVGVLDYLYFMLSFWSLSSGPIDRSRRFVQDVRVGFTRQDYSRLLGRGLDLLFLGMAYKFVFAWWFARQLPMLDGRDPFHLWLYSYCYGLDLFFDFAGYSHMAVGAAYLFGVRAPMNFRMPFVSEDIKDFWNRWHISLSFWLRDFLYTRLLMGMLRRKTFKNKENASRAGFMVNMAAMGLWHGPSVHYVLYGVYHGLLMVLTDLYQRRGGFHSRHRSSLWYRLLGILVTFHLVMFGFLIFSGHLITY